MVTAIMLILLVTVALFMATVYLSDRIETEKRNREMLSDYMEEIAEAPSPYPYGRTDMPSFTEDDDRDDDDFPGAAGRGRRRGDMREASYRASLFYSVIYENGECVSVSVENGSSGRLEKEELLELAGSVMKSGKTEGKTGEYMYMVKKSGERTALGFINLAVSMEQTDALLKQILAVYAASVVIVFIASLLISKAIIKPLEENDERQRRFISDAGHELKTPVAVIQASAELLEKETGENEWLRNIKYENGRMGGLVKQLLDLSRAENGSVEKEAVDLSKAVTGEALAMEAVAFEKGHALKQDIEEGLYVTGVPGQLVQAVSVLLDNAVSYSLPGSDIILTLRKDRHDAVLTVENACGEIPQEKMEHLFERVFRTDEARGEDGGHYGLGLPIAKAVAEGHGGTIGAEHADGRIVFTVKIPLIKS